MNRCSFCEWIPIVPWRVWPLAGHARLGQNTVVGSMTILLSWLCWGACQEEVCLDPHFLCNLTPPRLNVELPFVAPSSTLSRDTTRRWRQWSNYGANWASWCSACAEGRVCLGTSMHAVPFMS